MNSEIKREPLIRIAKNNSISFWKKVIVRTISISIAIVVSILFIWIVSGKNPFPAIGYMINGTFENKNKIFSFLKEFLLLLGVAVALVPAYKMKFWNVGAQGQILMGALMSAVVMIYCKALPNLVLIPLILIASILGGALWGFIPAFFKAKYHTNETLFTLMMNYIAIQLVSFATENWRGPKSSMGIINFQSEKGWFPSLGAFTGGDVIIPLIVVLSLVFVIYFYMIKTKHGYEVTVIGESRNTAKYIGIKYKWVIIRTLLLSGALCGLIGFFYVSGFDHTISATTSGSYGFTAIIVAWLGHFNPLLMMIYAGLIVFLNKGAINLKNVSYSPGLNEYSCEFIVLVIIIAIMLSEFFISYHFVFRNKKKIDKEQNNLNIIKEAK